MYCLVRSPRRRISINCLARSFVMPLLIAVGSLRMLALLNSSANPSLAISASTFFLLAVNRFQTSDLDAD